MLWLFRLECWFYRITGSDHDWRKLPSHRMIDSPKVWDATAKKYLPAWVGTAYQCHRCGEIREGSG
jgi:hypothetical protein